MKLFKFALVAASLGATIAPANGFQPSVAIGSNQFTIGVAGHVPVICRARVEASLVAPVAGTVSLGTLKEFCNSPAGYRVVADYSPALASAKLVVDGKEIALGDSGSVVVSESDQAAIAAHAVDLMLAEDGQTGSLSFRIEPR
ncbi:MAG TPA: hypothetical protein PK680_06110 [Novosphingobium sp.]|nr:hypothetical protein [Novosphingobium sp.]HQA17941.1 hypothetical protein [Novosphingobium sp.]